MQQSGAERFQIFHIFDIFQSKKKQSIVLKKKNNYMSPDLRIPYQSLKNINSI